MKKASWTPIAEMDLESGAHTCYATPTRHGTFVWLTQLGDDSWDVELHPLPGGEFVTVVNCKTLVSAKRYAARYLI